MNPKTIAACFAVFILASCVHTRPGDAEAMARTNQDKGVIYHNTPRGNPLVPAQWEQWGPGAVRNQGAGTLSVRASRTIGATEMARLATREDASPVEAFDRKIISEKDFNLLGSGPSTVAAAVKARFGWERDTEASVTMGKVQEVTLSEQELVEFCRAQNVASSLTPDIRRGLRNGDRHLLLAAVYADSMTFTFKRKTATGGEVDAGLPRTGNITVGGNNYQFTESGLVMTEPRFLGYRILHRTAVRTVF